MKPAFPTFENNSSVQHNDNVMFCRKYNYTLLTNCESYFGFQTPNKTSLKNVYSIVSINVLHMRLSAGGLSVMCTGTRGVVGGLAQDLSTEL